MCIIILIRQNLPKPEQHPVICPFLLKAARYGIIATTTKLRSHAIFDRLQNVLLISFALIAVVTFVVQIWTTSAIVNNYMERAQNERVAPDLPQIEADPAQLPNIFVNLVGNAADAMPEGGALTIQADLSPDRRSAVVQVKDTGIGIAPEDLTRIFDEFCRSKAAKAHSQMGTGLGLSLVKRIVETYDGRIDVQSAVGEGSAFTVTLPMDVSAQPSAPPASEE